MADSSKEARAQAEARFKRAQTALREGAEATRQYLAARDALQEKTARLKELRLAKEATEATEAEAARAAKKKAARPKPASKAPAIRKKS